MTSQLWPAWLVHGMHLMKEAEVPRALASLPSPRSSGFSARELRCATVCSCAALSHDEEECWAELGTPRHHCALRACDVCRCVVDRLVGVERSVGSASDSTVSACLCFLASAGAGYRPGEGRGRQAVERVDEVN